MTTSGYYANEIHCKCGTTFSAKLEDHLSDRLWEDRYANELEESEKYTCPNCKRSYELTVAVELTVERTLVDLVELEEDEYVQGVPLSILKGRWIGDKIVLAEESMEFEEEVLPTGIYFTGDKEYHVEDGIITNYWSMPDRNQLNLFEESLS